MMVVIAAPTARPYAIHKHDAFACAEFVADETNVHSAPSQRGVAPQPGITYGLRCIGNSLQQLV